MLIFKDREVFGQQPKGEYASSEDTNGDSNLGQGREVLDVAHEGRHVEQRVWVLDREPTDIETIEDHANENNDRACAQSIGAGAILPDGKPDDRQNNADEDLGPEEQAHSSACKEVTKFTCNGKFTEF